MHFKALFIFTFPPKCCTFEPHCSLSLYWRMHLRFVSEQSLVNRAQPMNIQCAGKTTYLCLAAIMRIWALWTVSAAQEESDCACKPMKTLLKCVPNKNLDVVDKLPANGQTVMHHIGGLLCSQRDHHHSCLSMHLRMLNTWLYILVEKPCARRPAFIPCFIHIW